MEPDKFSDAVHDKMRVCAVLCKSNLVLHLIIVMILQAMEKQYDDIIILLLISVMIFPIKFAMMLASV